MTGAVVQVSASAGGVPNHALSYVDVTTGGIAGDGWRHPQFHGIPKRAILLITAEGLDEIKAIDFPVFAGALGENLTTRGLRSPGTANRAAFRVWHRCEPTERASPSLRYVERVRHGIQGAVYDARAMKADPVSEVWGLSGLYASVIEPGVLRPGDSITLLAEST